VLILNDVPRHEPYIESRPVDLAQVRFVAHYTQGVGYELMPGRINGGFSLGEGQAER
jgi:hypothetical protein